MSQDAYRFENTGHDAPSFFVQKEAKLVAGVPLPNGKTALDTTITKNFQNCPAYLLEAYVHGITPKGYDKNIHFEFGKMWHKGLETWYKTNDIDVALKAIQDYPYEEQENAGTKTQTNALLGLKKYVERYPDDLLFWEILDVEEAILFEFAPNMYHAVIPDLVVKHKVNGRIYGVESKTTKYTIDSRYFNGVLRGL